MAMDIIHKKSSVSGKAPALNVLQFGELAINTYDGVIYLKKDSGSGAEVIGIRQVTDADNLAVDSAGLDYSDGATINEVLNDLDGAIAVLAAGGDPGAGGADGGDAGTLEGATLDDVVALAIALG